MKELAYRYKGHSFRESGYTGWAAFSLFPKNNFGKNIIYSTLVQNWYQGHSLEKKSSFENQYFFPAIKYIIERQSVVPFPIKVDAISKDAISWSKVIVKTIMWHLHFKIKILKLKESFAFSYFTSPKTLFCYAAWY